MKVHFMPGRQRHGIEGLRQRHVSVWVAARRVTKSLKGPKEASLQQPTVANITDQYNKHYVFGTVGFRVGYSVLTY